LKISGSELDIENNADQFMISQTVPIQHIFSLSKVKYEEPKQDGKVFITKVKITIRQFSLVEGRELNTIVEEMKWANIHR
jgi:hypothetical protein